MPRSRKRRSDLNLVPILLFLLIVGIFLVYSLKLRGTPSILSLNAPSPTPTPTRVPYAKTIDTVFQNNAYHIIAVPLEATASVSLIPNFNEREYPDVVALSNKCNVAINGGYYTGAHLPLGLFYTQGILLGSYVKGTVANGFFQQNKIGQHYITPFYPQSLEGNVFVMQSGPYMLVQPKKLSLIRDEYARRSLIGSDEINNNYVISVRSSDGAYSGPHLADIPLIFSQPDVQSIIPLTTLLNLDGGGASFFYSSDHVDTYYLPSISPVGSIICIKQSS